MYVPLHCQNERSPLRQTSTTVQILKFTIIMTLLAALQVHTNPYAPFIIAAFIIVTAALYCVPTLYRLVTHSRRNILESQDDLYTCHDEAFLHHGVKA